MRKLVETEYHQIITAIACLQIVTKSSSDAIKYAGVRILEDVLPSEVAGFTDHSCTTLSTGIDREFIEDERIVTNIVGI